METLTETLTALGLLSLAPLLWKMRRAFRQTALAGASLWFALAWLTLVIVRVVTVGDAASTGTQSLAWYIAATLSLSPAIAVLGARWPTARVWNTFVVLPLLAVFLWPVAVGVLRGSRWEHWVLEEPMVLGYLLVLVMGTGNYVGSRWTLPAFVWGAAWLLIVPALCPAFARFVPDARMGRQLGTLLITLAGWSIDWSVWKVLPQSGTEIPLERVWSDFRDLFGVVWSRRVQERFNEQAQQERWNVRIGSNGFEDSAGRNWNSYPPSAVDLAAAETHVRWLLQKFVESDWIDCRMKGRI